MAEDGLALVTGASGFVGSALARALIGSGCKVRVLLRPTSPGTALAGLDVERVQGDLRDCRSLAAAMKDVRWLFHAAADYRLWARRPADLFETNVGGTRSIMEAALKAGVERIIYTSSVATLAPARDGVPSDETCRLAAGDAVGPYKRSKIEAEELVRSMIGDGLPAVIVNPSTPVGPFDVRPTPTGRIIVETAAGRMPGYVDTGLNMVHVDDVAAGHLAALRRGQIGESYILGGQDASLREILTAIAREAGQPPPRFAIPRGLVVPVAFASETMARFSGREPLTTLDGVRMSKNRMFFSSAKAERELGYHARPYREGIRDAVDWFGKAGYLKDRAAPQAEKSQ